MADHDEHLEELARQCATATPFGRLNGVEQLTVLRWLIDGGHMTRTGKPLETPLQAPRVEARKADGSPTVTMR
jgi:hypothetical protein